MAFALLSFGPSICAVSANAEALVPSEFSIEFRSNLSDAIHRDIPSETEDDLNVADWSGAMAEVGTILVLGKAAYLAGGDTIARDFDYDIQGNELEYFHDRLFTKEYLKFDDNTKGMNWGHAYAGMIYYQAFRNYNFNVYESTLATFVTSTAWEAFFEYKEVVSINDQIVTTFGGAVLGESFFQFSEMLATKPGWVPAAFSGLFNPAKTIRAWFGYEQALRLKRDKVDDFFSVYAATILSQNNTRELDRSILALGFNASVNSMRGKYDSLSGTPTLVEMNAEFGLSELGLEEFQLKSLMVMGGYHYETAKKNRSRDSWYKNYYLGPSLGIEYSSFGADSDTEDFYVAVNLIGFTLGGEWRKNDVHFSAQGSIHGDFAMVKPFAAQSIDNYRDFYWNTKSSLWENAYAYALGHTANIQLAASYHNLTLNLSMRSQRWDSIDNKKIERYADWNPNRKDLDFKDARDRLKFQIDYAYNSRLTLGLNMEKIYRSGEFFGIDFPDFYTKAKDIETRTSLQVAYSY
jgi:hypothetical protein